MKSTRYHVVPGIRHVAFAAMLTAAAVASATQNNYWVGASGGGDGVSWANALNWSAGVPAAEHAVTIASGSVLLTNQTEELASFTMTGGTLTFSNWMTRLRATEVVITNTAALTLPPAFTNTQMSNRVWIACSNLTLGVNARIDADNRGYSGTESGTAGHGEGYALYGGTAHGGFGSGPLSSRAKPYGDAAAPIAPGSGGIRNYTTVPFPNGGGAVRIDADGHVAVHGKVLADGGTGSDHVSSKGGSGGSVFIRCRTFGGSATGLISSRGGDTRSGNKPSGGRIAIVYHAGAQAERVPVNPGVTFDLRRGRHYTSPYTPEVWAEPGTLYLPDTQFLSSTMGTQWNDVRFVIPGLTEWVVSSLQVSGWIAFDPPLRRLRVDGDLVLDANSRLTLYSSPTNALSSPHGVFLDIGGALTMSASGATLDLISDPTNGAAPYVECQTLEMESGSVIYADGRGYDYARGPSWDGVAAPAGGGGYGGKGGGVNGGRTYGNMHSPVQTGSGGTVGVYPSSGGRGGGLVRIGARGSMRVDGTIRADGMANQGTAPGGSGGAILLSAHRFCGTGVLRVRGGDSHYNQHAGGGGRIAVWMPYLPYLTINAMSACDRPPAAAEQIDPIQHWPQLTCNLEGGTPAPSGSGLPGAASSSCFFAKLRSGSLFMVR